MNHYDVIIIGAGAAGLMCGATAGKRGKSVLILDHVKKAGEKIRISGGGRCNFTNLHTTPNNFLSENPRFAVSALSRFTPQDFIALVKHYNISYHEKTLGQLFCDGSSQQIIDMLLSECKGGNTRLELNSYIKSIEKKGENFYVHCQDASLSCNSLVIATGGKSIPKMGATGFGYDVANQFGLNIIPTRAGLVPLIFQGDILNSLQKIAGVSLEVAASFGKHSFREGLLFTHRGLSGPAILQISSYMQEGESVTLNLAPDKDIFTDLKNEKTLRPKQEIHTIISETLPKRLAHSITEQHNIKGKLADSSHKQLQELGNAINHWQLTPSGTEGFRTAEVTVGGVDTAELSSTSLECKKVKGLYFIGEVVDVTGHLGGFNFQWAWASGYAAGGYV